MHEMGYTFSGESSFYNLTMSEIEQLKEGFEVAQRRKAQNRTGQSGQAVQHQAKKHRMKHGSKRRARERFKKNRVNS